MPTLPEALLLFALHDQKGTVQPSAFLALDHALRGAVLSELKLRGFVQVRANGDLRPHPKPPPAPPEPFLATAWAVIAQVSAARPCVEVLSTLQRAGGDVRASVRSYLSASGVLTESRVDRMGLPSDVVHPMADGTHEAALREQVAAGLAAGDAVSPRIGALIALAVAAHLEDELFGDVAAAKARADWVAERDAVVRAVQDAVARVEGW